MNVYTVGHVQRLLRNYIDIRYALEGRTQSLPDAYIVAANRQSSREKPFGMDGRPWPFMEIPHAKAPTDGKQKARFMEDLHCSVLDLEDAFTRTSDDDLELIYQYHVFQTHTLDELILRRNMRSRGSMSQRIHRAVERLTKTLNEPSNVYDKQSQ